MHLEPASGYVAALRSEANGAHELRNVETPRLLILTAGSSSLASGSEDWIPLQREWFSLRICAAGRRSTVRL